MAEKHRCQAQRLCVNNCGFFGSPATQNLCSKCFRDLHLKQQPSQPFNLNQSIITPTISSSPPPPPSSSESASAAAPVLDSPVTSSSGAAAAAENTAVVAAPAVVVQPNRCLTCRKKVGLMGFKCRCEMVFCGSHRYPEQHNCVFDFKSMGKEQIAKANPVIKADKLEKI